jgi:hypothetical protein
MPFEIHCIFDRQEQTEKNESSYSAREKSFGEI